jgi:predicted O-methyltransferase YrrM
LLTRTESFAEYFGLEDSARSLVSKAALMAGERAEGMMDRRDYEALAAVGLHLKPRRIFEIGTYLGVTSDFFLELLPDCQVVSIAYPNSRWNLRRRVFNNSELRRDLIGRSVHPDRRTRFTQLYGDSHKIASRDLVDRYGCFDLVLIDGDHSGDGVAQDTVLAGDILTESGAICWHDANPKEKYLDVKLFLEQELRFSAVATKDDYVGGIACWSADIERRLSQQRSKA